MPLSYYLIGISLTFLVQLVNSSSTVNAAENLDRFWSILTGDQQTPPVTTDAIGYVGLKSQDDRTRLMYSVHAEHIGKVTAVPPVAFPLVTVSQEEEKLIK